MTANDRNQTQQTYPSDRAYVVLRSAVLVGALSVLLISNSLAKEIVVGPANAPQKNGQRKALFEGQADVGRCRLLNGVVAIRRSGAVFWNADVASLNRNDAYCTRLIFLDKNDERIFQFPFICSPTLTDTFNTWQRADLAIPEHIYPSVRKIVRNDKC